MITREQKIDAILKFNHKMNITIDEYRALNDLWKKIEETWLYKKWHIREQTDECINLIYDLIKE